LYVDVDSVEHTTLLNLETKEENSAAISERVSAARQKQYSRQKNQGKLNGSLTTRAVKQVADLTDEAKQLLDMAGAQLGLSARAYMRAVKVARTIADLDDSKNVTEKHIAEALQYRPKPASI
jgi:magnesium chelatase family protein